MPGIRVGRIFSKGLFTNTTAVFSLALLALLPGLAHAAGANPLNFNNNWFVTGDYAVAGVGLMNTGGVGTINMSGVPCISGTGAAAAVVACTTPGSVPAYPVAAFLYWETVENTPNPASVTVSVLQGVNGYFDGYPIQGQLVGNDATSACWISPNKSQVLRVYRADVLRDLPFDPTTNIRLANGAHPVALGAGVTGISGVLATEGASLVVIYRLVAPGKPLLAPLRSVVIYDGEFTLDKKQPLFTQTIEGFYQASTNPLATMTHIVGNGQAADSENLDVNSVTAPGVKYPPFPGGQGAGWDNVTFPFTLASNAASVVTSSQLTGVQGSTPACLSWAAVVTSTNVQDTDHDGLLDVWESAGLHRNTQVSPATFGACADYPNDPCVDLPAMGAKNSVQDIFLHIDWMHGSTGTYHTHIPPLSSLTMVANAFTAHNIAVHFDVGNNYQTAPIPSYIVPYKKKSEVLALGGADIDESTLLCQPTQGHPCDYVEPYPVISFKFGLASIRDGNSALNIPQHLPQNEKDTHHYVLLAHALAGPYNPDGTPLDPNDPSTTSGIGDRPGGDLMVTLGLWPSVTPAYDQVGSPLMVAGTLMHELGHNLDLSHAGWNSTPNCMPDYPSVMSYLYQISGLTDVNGVEQVDYSNGLLAGLNEDALSATNSLGTIRYRVRYFGPAGGTATSGQLAGAHCDGTPLNGPSLVYTEWPTLATPDWSNGTEPIGTKLMEDINFDGVLGQVFADQPDWSSLNLQQVGGRLNFGSVSNGLAATDVGLAATDLGLAATDLGLSATDLGLSATDLGLAATDLGLSATDLGLDANYLTTIQTGGTPIPTPQSCPGCGLFATNSATAITLNWTPPATGGGLTYNIYRCAGAGCNPQGAANQISAGWSPANAAAPTYTDTVNYTGTSCTTCDNITYTYEVTAIPSGGTEGGYSNSATSEVTHLFVIADNQAVTYGTANPTPTFKIYGDVAGSLTPAQVSCAYVPAAPRNAGVYPIVCSGPASTSATDTVTYNQAYQTYTPGVLTISQKALTITATTNTKTYDSTISAMAVPTVSGLVTANGDTVTTVRGSAETYDTPTAGTTKTLSVAAYTVNDQNGGNNYAVTLVTYKPGTISPAPLTVTADNKSMVYGGPLPTLTATITGFVGGQTLATSGVMGSAAVTTTATVLSGVTGSPYPITPAVGTLNAVNYSFATFTNGNLTVTPAPLTVTADNKSMVYGGPLPALTATISGFVLGQTLATSGVSGGASVTTTATVLSGVTGSPYPITPTVGTLTAVNYSFATFTNGNLTVTPAPLTVTADNKSMVYGGPLPTLTATITGFVLGQTLANSGVSGGATVTTAATVLSGVTGSPYAITPTVGTLTAVNYSFATFTNGNLTVTPAPLTVTADNKSMVYGGPLPTLTATISGFVLGQTLATSDVSGSAAFTTTATISSVVSGSPYSITPTVGMLKSANYYFATFTKGNLTVTPAPLTVTADNKSMVYGGPLPTLTATITGFVLGQTLATSGVSGGASVTTTATVLSGVTGSPYAITPTVGTLTAVNYSFATFTNGNLTVTPAPLTVTADNKSMVYGGPLPTLTATITGFVLGQTLATSGVSGGATVTTAATVLSGVTGSPYAITPAVGTLTAVNYSFATFTNGNLTVTPAPLTVTADNKSMVYGGPLPALTATISGFVLGQTLATSDVSGSAAFTTTATISSVVSGSPYSITPTVGMLKSANYYFATFTNGNLTVTPAPLTVTADNKSMVYGGPLPTLTATITGFVLGQTLATSDVSGTATVTTTATISSVVSGSPYSITPTVGTLKSANYNFATFTNGNLTVTLATPSVTATGNTCTYNNGSTCAGSGSATGVLSPPEPLGPVTLSYSGVGGTVYGPSGTAPANAGSYTVTATFAGNTNYQSGSSVPAAITISKAAANVTLSNMTTLTYTGGPLMPTVTTIPSGLAVSLVGAPGTNAGGYPVTATITDPNYTGSAGGTFVIQQYPLTVTAAGVNKSFDGTVIATVTLTDNRISANDTFTDSYTSASFANPGPGQNISVNVTGISITGTSAGNYTWNTTATTTANITDSINLAALTVNGSPTLVSGTNGPTLRLTNDAQEAGSAWWPTALPVSGAFTTSFSFQITPLAGLADGFAFVIQNSGVSALGEGGPQGCGGCLGYTGISNSIAIEFDTYTNSDFGDPAGPPVTHIGIQSLGTAPNSSNHNSSNLTQPVPIVFADSSPHTATITYDGNVTLTVSLDGNHVATATLPSALGTYLGLSGGTAYAGFTAATGSDSEYSDILGWTWN